MPNSPAIIVDQAAHDTASAEITNASTDAKSYPPAPAPLPPVVGAPLGKQEAAQAKEATDSVEQQHNSATHGDETRASKNPLDRGVTLYKNVTDTVGEKRTLRQCLRHIRSHATLEKLIRDLRLLFRRAEASGADDDWTAYDQAKKKLPAFTMSGTFARRGAAGLERYSGVIQADLDHLKEKGFDLGDMKARVSADPHVEFVFDSPSGDGLKCGFLVESIVEDHAEAFVAMQRYFEKTYGIRPDDACKDVNRLCFLSYDPDVLINEQAAPFDWRACRECVTVERAEDEDEDENAGDLPLDAFPEVMQEMARHCSIVFQVDEAMAVVSALTIMAAALGNSVRCSGAVNGRLTPCNVYTVISAPSGYGKGVAGVVAKPLVDASAEMVRRFEEAERPQLRADTCIAEARKKVILADLKGDKLTDAGRAEARAELGRLEAEIVRAEVAMNRCPAYYTGNATGVGLGLDLKRNGECLLSFALEAGDAIRIAAGKFDAQGKGDYDLLLSGYTGEPFADSRASRDPLRLNAPCLTLLWTVQPTLVSELYGTVEAQERGVLARINVIRCGHDVAPYDDGVDRELPPKLMSRWGELVRAALDLRVTGRSVTTFRVAAEAKEIFRKFHNEAIDIRNGEGREHESKLARCRENSIRIALVFAATDWLQAGAEGDPILSAEHAARGVAVARYFLAESINLCQGAALERRQARLQEVVNLVNQAGGVITLRTLRKNHGVGEAELGQIVARHPDLLRIETQGPGARGGRPSPRLVLVQK